MIPDWLIYTGVACLVVSLALTVQGEFIISMVLSATSVVAFSTRLYLDRRSQRRATA